ncbi:hypothetical protein SLE2022_070750 [Rubroshorea leprosula]
MSHGLSHDPLNSSMFFVYPEKVRDILVLATRIAVLVCLVSSISFVLFIAFYPRSPYIRFKSVPYRDAGGDPHPATTNISHVLFGIGGSAKTWKTRRVYSSLWWEPDTTRGVVWLDENPHNINDSNNEIYGPEYRVSSPDWTSFKFSSSRSAVRIARIIRDSFNQKLPNVRWFVMGDDDTVYFTENLVSVLAKYDHREMWYIGGNSESVEQDVMHAYGMAFGGGGFAVSYPLAEKLVSILDGCLDRYYYFYGSDQRIWACITEIGVPLEQHPGFHQFDIRGDPYGILAAHPIAPLVSFHHLDYVAPIFPDKTQTDSVKVLMGAYRADPPRILQQSFCYDINRKWSFLIAWGYTIQIYPLLLTPFHLQTPLQTFKTWRSWSNGPFTFNTRPLPPDPCQQPALYFLDRVDKVGVAGTQTSYKMAQADKKCNSTNHANVMAVKRITVSSLKMPPDYWQKAPQRQCCEILDHGRIKDSSLRIRIRKCRQWENVGV